ncbi:hypothetical protein [Caldimonas sp. KR1-144]|uniref:hypothetical protein n=1 Tax=Caldimonas sp. KR1-144 TaxID=3400911 RepID=UPI003C0E81D6
MRAITIHLSGSLQRYAKQYAAQEGISVDQLVGIALAEKLLDLATEDYLARRARRGCRKKFDAALARSPAGQPSENDNA